MSSLFLTPFSDDYLTQGIVRTGWLRTTISLSLMPGLGTGGSKKTLCKVYVHMKLV